MLEANPPNSGLSKESLGSLDLCIRFIKDKRCVFVSRVYMLILFGVQSLYVCVNLLLVCKTEDDKRNEHNLRFFGVLKSTSMKQGDTGMVTKYRNVQICKKVKFPGQSSRVLY